MTRKLALLALVAGFLTAASVQADTTYTYTGNPFTIVIAPYTTSNFVTAMVTLASPLGRNFPLQPVTPLAFSLSDGLQTITNLTATDFGFEFATDSTGFIIERGCISGAGNRPNAAGARHWGVRLGVWSQHDVTGHMVPDVRRARRGVHLSIVISVLDGVGCSGPAVQASRNLTARGLAEVALLPFRR